MSPKSTSSNFKLACLQGLNATSMPTTNVLCSTWRLERSWHDDGSHADSTSPEPAGHLLLWHSREFDYSARATGGCELHLVPCHLLLQL